MSCLPKTSRIELGDPSRQLKVIGAGYSKNGTLSMQYALKKLPQDNVVHGATQSLFPGDIGEYAMFHLSILIASLACIIGFAATYLGILTECQSM